MLGTESGTDALVMLKDYNHDSERSLYERRTGPYVRLNTELPCLSLFITHDDA